MNTKAILATLFHSTYLMKIGWTLIASSVIILATGMEEHMDALITAIPSTLSVVVGIILILRGQKKLHIDVNNRLSQLLTQTSKASHAEGVEQERAEERERQEGK
jgi:hypothetical protein